MTDKDFSSLNHVADEEKTDEQRYEGEESTEEFSIEDALGQI